MIEELSKPDPFYVRLEIANELERVATELRARRWTLDSSAIDARLAMDVTADIFDDRASKIRGQLQREANREAREQDAAE